MERPAGDPADAAKTRRERLEEQLQELIRLKKGDASALPKAAALPESARRRAGTTDLSIPGAGDSEDDDSDDSDEEDERDFEEYTEEEAEALRQKFMNEARGIKSSNDDDELPEMPPEDDGVAAAPPPMPPMPFVPMNFPVGSMPPMPPGMPPMPMPPGMGRPPMPIGTYSVAVLFCC